ncbi:gag/pol protein [Cucumis melo var. makuwa]|uniref:Gag/pol protein n=1 Tax=Cucumis melo var. makuwa TaxID=1194695 RepID=A0A5D3DG50_CUCMM|nr:gag/pol protein [Cucumis melo var. makuwa]
MPRCSGKIVSQPNRYLDNDRWVKAMDLEMESTYFNSVWDLVDLPEVVNLYGANGSIREREIQLGRYSMQNSKKGLLPFKHGVHLSKEHCPKTPQEVEDMRRISYASTMGSLMYVMLYTRPDIYYAVGIVNRYQFNPRLDHWTVVKIILKYPKRTRDYMFMYGAKDLIHTGYIDSDFQIDKDSKKLTSGSVFILNGEAVVWRSIK